MAKPKKHKITRLVISILLTTLICATVLLAYLASRNVEEHLKDYIAASTHNEYTLAISDVRINYFKRTITLSSVQLTAQKENGQHYYFAADYLQAKGISLRKLIFDKKIDCKKLEVADPVFEVYSNDKMQNLELDRNLLFDKLLPFFNKKFKSISVKDIELKRARVSQYKLASDSTSLNSINKFDIGINDFYIDSAFLAQRNELFRATEINLKIKNFKHMLGDSIHKLHVGELSYSIKSKRVKGTNINLSPIDTAISRQTLYWMTIPELGLHSDGLRNMLGNDTVQIDSLYLKKCLIRIKPPQSSKGLSLRKLREFDLYQLLRNDFKLVSINHLYFESKNMCIESRTTNPEARQIFNNIEVELDKFLLDEDAYSLPNKILYADNFSLQIGKYSLNLNDQVHHFEAENITTSSRDSIISAKNLQLVPASETRNLPTTVSLNCDSVRLLSVDLARLFHHREMPLQEISAFHPILTINQFRDKTGNGKNGNSLLYQFIGDYIKGIYANVIAIDRGHFSVNDFRNKADTGNLDADFNFRLTDFSLDSVSSRKTDKLFFATNIELHFDHYQMKLADQLHQLEVEKIDISSLQRTASIKNLHLFPQRVKNIEERLKQLKRTELYEIKAPALVMHNTDIKNAFFRKQLIVNSFSILQPEIYFEVFANQRKTEKSNNLEEFHDLLNNYISHIEIGKINAPDGKIRFVNHSRKGKTIDITNKFSLALDHFVLNDAEIKKDRLLFSDFFELKLQDHLFKLSDNVHILQAGEISLSSKKSSIQISKALLYPDITSPDYKKLPWHIQVNIPQIQLSGVDLQKAFLKQELNVAELLVQSPLIEIYKNSKRNNKVNFKDITVPLPEELKELTINKTALVGGSLKVYNVAQYSQKQIATTKIDFNFDQVSLKRTDNNSTARFSSRNIETRLSSLHLTPEKGPYTIDVSGINFSAEKKLLTFTDLNILPRQANDKPQFGGMQIPKLHFGNLDPHEAFQNNRFHASVIEMTSPVFHVNLTGGQHKTNPFRIKLPPTLLAVMDELSAEKVLVQDATFFFNKNKKLHQHQHIDISLNHFHLDSLISEKPLGSDNLKLVRNNTRFTDKKNHYNFMIDKIMFTSNNNNLSFTGITIDPKYSGNAYQKVIPFQTDHYSGTIDRIDFSDIDLDRWFKSRELTGTKLTIDKAKIDIYRDKQTPFNENQHLQMPQVMIKKLKFPFYFDSLLLVNSDISYAEQLENLADPGWIIFTHTNMSLTPFTNLPDIITTRPIANLSASAMLMGASQMNVRMDFDMSSPVSSFTASGSLSPFDMTILNPVTEKNARIMVKSGEVNRFDFDFTADSVKSTGKLRFAYDNLKISILEQKDGDTKEAKFASFLANSLMLRSKNPRTRILLPDDIYFERDPKRSIINYWWKTIFSGAKNTFGIKDDKE